MKTGSGEGVWMIDHGRNNSHPLAEDGVVVRLPADRVRVVTGVLLGVRGVGGSALTIVRGDAGQGKSTVLRSIGDAARRRGDAVVAMRGGACAANVPYAGVLELITSDAADPCSELVEQLTSLSATTSPLAVAYAVGLWFQRQATGRRLIVLVDDADLVDEDSLRVVAYAVTRLGGASTGLVHTTTRPVPLLTRLPVMPLRLDDLGHTDAVGCAVTAGAAERSAVRLVDRFGGNPLALVHAATAFAPGGERSWPGEPPVAARLMRDVDTRVEPLAPGDRRVLEAAAVTGEDRLEHLVVGRSGPRESPLDVLDRLEASGLVVGSGQRLRWTRPWMALAVRERCGPGQRAHLAEQLRRPRPVPASPAPPTVSGRTGLDTALTASERRVVDVIVLGATVKQAAGQLCLSDRTVGTHLQSVYRKLGVRSRGELAALLLAGVATDRPRPRAEPVRR